MSFAIEKQEQAFWCWAAVAVSVDRYFSPESVWTQCAVAGDVLKTSCCGSPAACNVPARVQDALNSVRRFDTRVPRALRFDEVRTEIDAGYPVCVRIEWRGGSGHFVVIAGYRIAAGREFVSVADPLFPDSLVPYSVFRTAYQNPENPFAGAGQWTHTYIVKR